MNALRAARTLSLPDWCLAAGFVRNLVWDHLHDYPVPTPLNDLDLVYFDRTCVEPCNDLMLEHRLKDLCPMPWSVKNQARMHDKNGLPPFASTADAIGHWVEVETAVGVFMDGDDCLHLVAPLGTESLMAGRITVNPRFPQPQVLQKRLNDKGWLRTWPNLSVTP